MMLCHLFEEKIVSNQVRIIAYKFYFFETFKINLRIDSNGSNASTSDKKANFNKNNNIDVENEANKPFIVE
jgi:hypothetical protein